jgi:hypothetical protein
LDVRIKDLTVAMELKNKGMELEVRDAKGTHLGDLYISRGAIEWCTGKTRRGGGTQKSWDDLIGWYENKKK